MKLTEQDKSWVRQLFMENEKLLNSDFDKAWEEGTFYGIPEIGFIRMKLGPINIICELAISQPFRRKGYAGKLLRYAISPCLVATHVDNIAANKLYERNGFLHQGEAPGSDGSIMNIYLKR